jgi:hypothetical protein
VSVAPFITTLSELDPDLVKLMSDLDWVRSAWSKGLRTLDAYMAGEQDLGFLAEAVREHFGDDMCALILNFPELVVEAHNDRLDVEGFRFPGESTGDETLWRIWQANNMDEQSVMGHTDALGLSRAAVIVGPNGDDPTGEPIITVESPFDVSWIRHPATGQAIKGQKCWVEDDRSEWRSLYDLEQTRVVTRDKGSWRVVQTIRHGMGRLPLVPLVNRPRIKRANGWSLRDGRSEFESIIGLTDAANKIATDMMTSAEYHAMPRRWAFGLKAADFKDANGNQKSAWSFIKGRLWANENPDIKVGQFPESDLANFHNTIKLLVRLVGMLTAMPIDYSSFESVNPPSADALRSAESRLVKRVERRQTSFGGSWEEVMRLALQTKLGSLPAQAMALETVWRNPATPTIAQKYDAIVKGVTTRGADGRPLVPTEQGRIDLGYTPAQRADMLRMEQEAGENDAELAAARALTDANQPDATA